MIISAQSEIRQTAADLEHARSVRALLKKRGILMINVIGASGSGKTALIGRSLIGLDLRCAAVTGDAAGDLDAQELRRRGCPCVQINTEAGRLDAESVERALALLPLDALDVIFVENVGNLNEPAKFDLGEDCKVTVVSFAESSDAPRKYSAAFSASAAVVLTKTDLKIYVDFDEIQFWDDVTRLNPRARRLRVSSTGGDGLEFWIKLVYAWADAKKGAASAV